MDNLEQIASNLKAEAQASGSEPLDDLAYKILTISRTALAFKRSGMYREAAYTAGFAVRAISDFLTNHNASDSLLEAKSALESILNLPPISPDRRVDTVVRRPGEEPSVPDQYAHPERFRVGMTVRIADKAELQAFREQWKFHHPLQDEQLKFAGMITSVESVGYYHGGDILYTLADTGDYVWHESCLRE